MSISKKVFDRNHASDTGGDEGGKRGEDMASPLFYEQKKRKTKEKKTFKAGTIKRLPLR